MVPVAPGKHRRSEAQLPQAPDRMPLSAPEYFQPPGDAAGPALGATDMWRPARGGTFAPQAYDTGGSPAANEFPGRADSDWQVDANGGS